MRVSRNSLKHDLLFGIILTALVFASALIFGGPFLSTGSPAAASAEISAVQHAPAKTATLNGTLTRKGPLMGLNDGKGGIWQLDNIKYVRELEGRLVSVTGVLNSQARRMHVEKIESIDA